MNAPDARQSRDERVSSRWTCPYCGVSQTRQGDAEEPVRLVTFQSSAVIPSPDVFDRVEGECFNCAGEASERYALVLEQETVLEDKLLCEPCASALGETDWIEVHEAPVRMRDRNGTDHEAAESDDSG